VLHIPPLPGVRNIGQSAEIESSTFSRMQVVRVVRPRSGAATARCALTRGCTRDPRATAEASIGIA